MINANELRVGNWVLFDGTPKRVGSIDLDLDDESEALVDSIESYGNPRQLRNVGIDPIPLTPEILEKAGFERGVMPFTGELGYSKSNQGAGYFFGLVDNGDNGYMFHNPHFNRNFKYLHQLQNLYFALTGEELKIEL